MRLLIVSIALIGLLMGGCETLPSVDAMTDRGWSNLFNGKNLDGWACEGDLDAWGVVDGELVTLKPGKGWWLRTDKMYRDFELKLEFWMPEGGNSGGWVAWIV